MNTATKTMTFFPIKAEKLANYIEDSWVLFASGPSTIGKRVTLELQTGKAIARVTVDEKLCHKGDIDYALQLFNQNVKHD